MGTCSFQHTNSAVHTVVEREGGLQAAQMLEPHLHPPCSAAERWHCLGFPVGSGVLGQPGIVHPARGGEHCGLG